MPTRASCEKAVGVRHQSKIVAEPFLLAALVEGERPGLGSACSQGLGHQRRALENRKGRLGAGVSWRGVAPLQRSRNRKRSGKDSTANNNEKRRRDKASKSQGAR